MDSPSPGARKTLTVVGFVLAVLGLFVYVGEVVTDVSGGMVAQAPVEGVSPEAGESIYFGKGKCSTCHSIGERGSAIRGPNHGVNAQFEAPMGLRAEERARERSRDTGRAFTATEYLVESIADPGAYVVSGYKNEMPLVYRPPIALKPDEVRAVIMFLQSEGGEVNAEAIKLPDVILRAAQESKAAPWAPYLVGDAEAGAALFFDEQSNAGCGRCHTVNGRGGDVGPELSTVAGTRTAQYIVQSILQPSAEIASGFEPYLVETKDGRYLTGVLKSRNDHGVTLKTERGVLLNIPAAEIREVAPQDISIMPGSFADDLSVTEFHDVLAFVLTLTGEEKTDSAGAQSARDHAQGASAGDGHAQ